MRKPTHLFGVRIMGVCIRLKERKQTNKLKEEEAGVSPGRVKPGYGFVKPKVLTRKLRLLIGRKIIIEV